MTPIIRHPKIFTNNVAKGKFMEVIFFINSLAINLAMVPIKPPVPTIKIILHISGAKIGIV
jgi:hypothetical protein